MKTTYFLRVYSIDEYGRQSGWTEPIFEADCEPSADAQAISRILCKALGSGCAEAFEEEAPKLGVTVSRRG